MSVPHTALAERVAAQRTDLPEVYGDIDFAAVPYRFTVDPAAPSALPARRGDRAAYLADTALVDLLRTATLLGDVTADRVAALSSSYRVSELVTMVAQVCRDGLDAHPDTPAPVAALIREMERLPDWIDRDLVERGAAVARLSAGLLAPFITRGAFIATFTNSYAALPMTITGALSGTRAAHRVNETTAFFAVTTLPGALDRYGPGFQAAAMVRLMHSMVRYNALHRSTRWDPAVYGIPVPQSDQLPAGLIGPYLTSLRALRSGRTEFTSGERAMVEFSRYRCFLLGLPEELVPSTPQGIVDMFHGRAATLRHGFDDDCLRLVRSTMDAYLRPGDGPFDRAADAVERSYSKVAFTQAFCDGDRAIARRMGVDLTLADYARVAVTAPFLAGRVLVVGLAARRRRLRPVVDRYLVRQVRHRLDVYGIPKYTSDVAEYAH
ncbi:oxygenase MpaB family protein [Gordonia sp. FQ]|uniref:oxygenase MpaB family protein n=1 Tax=Gordonia sp. FQ TaxID=3446634 RepID=UPI003F82B55F